jgi:hypothetical protein
MRGRGLLVGCFFAWAAPDAAAQLTQTSSGFAFARIVDVTASVQEMPGPNQLDVTLGATATDVLDLADDQYLEDFVYDAKLLGAGSATWGAASASLSLEASSKPRTSPPAPGGPPQALENTASAQAGGRVQFAFEELGILTSASLPAETPVDVVLHCSSRSLGTVLATLDPPNETRVGASSECRLVDNSAGFVGVELFTGGNQIKTVTLTSAVGHELDIRGIFRVTGEAFAGADCCFNYLGETEATVEGSGGLWIGLPAGVDLDAASGHDYTVPVPEPSASPLAIAALTAVRSWRARIGVGLRARVSTRDRPGSSA